MEGNKEEKIENKIKIKVIKNRNIDIDKKNFFSNTNVNNFRNILISKQNSFIPPIRLTMQLKKKRNLIFLNLEKRIFADSDVNK